MNGVVEEEVYVEKPLGFETRDRKNHVGKLKKTLNGLKQALKIWSDKMDNFLMRMGFTKSKVDSNLYFKVEDEILVILLLYVNDLFLTGEEKIIKYAKRRLGT